MGSHYTAYLWYDCGQVFISCRIVATIWLTVFTCENRYITAWARIYSDIYRRRYVCVFKLYKSIWRFAKLYGAEICYVYKLNNSYVTHIFYNVLFGRMPISYYILWGYNTVLAIGSRFSYRFVLCFARTERIYKKPPGILTRVMIVGAGNAGRLLVT